MAGAELGLAIMPIVELCFKYGNTFIRMCRSYRPAEKEIIELVVRIENQWKRTALQLDFLRRVCQRLDEEHLRIQRETLQILIGKLQLAISKVEKVKNYPETAAGAEERRIGNVKRWKYVLTKEGFSKAIEDLEIWQRIFDPTWFLIMTLASPQIDTELAKDDHAKMSLSSAHDLRSALTDSSETKKTVFLPDDGLKSAQIIDIPFSPAKVAQRKGSKKWLILDTVAVPPQADHSMLTRDVRNLARKLSYADPITFGLLNCYGVVRGDHSSDDLQSDSFCFVFTVPQGMSEPRSLRSGLISEDANHSLSERFRLAKDLGQSVCYIHTYGFVHKNIRPDTIVTFRDGKSSLGSSFLLGFENFRSTDGRTLRLGDSRWEKNLYRHPRRQSATPEDEYIMQHDIYSLGVCLLEVGLWQSFVIYDEEMTPLPSPVFGMTVEDIKSTKRSFIKDHLVSLAKGLLPRRMGTQYAQIVETCLTCLDEDNVDFGDEREFQDEDGILVAVRYIEKVLLQLNSISV